MNRERWRLLGAIGAASLPLLILASFNCMNLFLHRLHGAGHTDIARQVVKEFAVPPCVAAVAALRHVWLALKLQPVEALQ